MKENWQEFARQSNLFVSAVETLFSSNDDSSKDNNESLENYLGTLPNLYREIQGALTRFDGTDENIIPPESVTKLLELTNESLKKIVFQADIARMIVSRSSELHLIVEELFRAQQVSSAFLRQLIRDLRLDFSTLSCELPPVLHPVVDYEKFVPVMEWQSEPQVYGQGIQTALLLLHVIPEFQFQDNEIDEMVFAAIMQDIGLLALEKIHRQPCQQLNQTMPELFELHPRYSVAMLSGVSGSSMQLLKMVGEHHERDNGTGFPRGENSYVFSRGSRLLAMAARFVSRCSEDTTRNETPDGSLLSTDFLSGICQKILTETLREQFDYDLMQQFIAALRLKATIQESDLASQNMFFNTFDNQTRRVDQAEKLLPQPQLLTALGLSNVKPRFSSPS